MNILSHPEIRQIYDAGSLAVLAIDTDGLITYANAAATCYLQTENTQLTGLSLFCFFHDRTKGETNKKALLSLDVISDQEFEVETLPGQERWVLLTSNVHRDEKGQVETYLYIRDVSALKKKENLFAYLNKAVEELAKARDTESALERIALFIVPKFANWFTINLLRKGQLEPLLLKHEDPAKIKWAREYREQFPTDMSSESGAAQVLKTGEPIFISKVTEAMITERISDPIQRQALQRIGIRSVITVPLGSHGQFNGTVTFISTEPERHFDTADLDFACNFANHIGLALENARLNEASREELELRKKSEAQFRFLTDAIPHKLWTSGPDGRATYYNQGWYDYTGISGLEALREQIWDILHPDDRAIAAVEWPMAILRGEGMELEHRFRRQDGMYRWHLSRFTAHKNEAGETVLWVGTSTDIHEQKIARMESAEANQELAATNEELAAVNEEQVVINEELTETQKRLHETIQKLETAYEQLKESAERQARLAAIVSTSDDTIVSKTLQGIITSWNAAAQRMFGYTENEVLGKHISLIIPPERLQEEDLIISRIRNGDSIDHFETVRRAKDGREVSVSLSISPILDDSGQVIGASKIARDISKQKEFEEKLQRYTRNVEILNTVGKLVAESLDIQAILQRVTDATTQITGAAFGAFFYNQLDERGESYMLFTLSGAPREAFEKFGMPRNTAIFNPTFSGEQIVRSADITKDPRYGHNRPHYGMPEGHLPVVSYLAVPVISKSGSVVGGLFYGHPEVGRFTEEHEKLVAGIANQASVALDNAKLYEEIRNLNAKKDEFIGLASHELKTPITSLSGFLQIISKRMPEGDINKTFVEKALNQTGKLSALIGDLLDVTKIESGQLPLTYSSFDLVSMIRELIEQLQFTTRSHHIAFYTDTALVMINADRQRLEQVVINLLSNAIKYSPRADLVKVSIAVYNGRATVRIQDFGMGIALEQQARIFSRFYRVEGVDDHISGLGIGLYISKEIISRHNGQLKVESEPDKGSVFIMEIPV